MTIDELLETYVFERLIECSGRQSALRSLAVSNLNHATDLSGGKILATALSSRERLRVIKFVQKNFRGVTARDD